ncbi:peptidylprolyl isomerase [Rhodococcus hoagii]|nr:peptidylprolyl isomerase [Prescottella equi]
MDVHYHGVEYDSNEVFELVVPAWRVGRLPSQPVDPGLAGRHPRMKVGGRRKLTVSSELAYGPAGGGHQLSGKTLVFRHRPAWHPVVL